MRIFNGRALLMTCAIAFVTAAAADAQPSTRSATNPLRDLNAAIESLASTVAPSIVQVIVTGYRSVDDTGRGEAGLVISRQRSVGSGAIIDTDGYIITNASRRRQARQEVRRRAARL